MHGGVGLGKIFQKGVHESKLKIGIISLGSGSKSQPPEMIRGSGGETPSTQRFLRCVRIKRYALNGAKHTQNKYKNN